MYNHSKRYIIKFNDKSFNRDFNIEIIGSKVIYILKEINSNDSITIIKIEEVKL